MLVICFLLIFTILFYNSKQHSKFFKSLNFAFLIFTFENLPKSFIRITTVARWRLVKVSYNVNGLLANTFHQFRIFRKVFIRAHSTQHSVNIYMNLNPPVQFNRDWSKIYNNITNALNCKTVLTLPDKGKVI